MSRRRNFLELLVGNLVTLAVLSAVVGLLAAELTPWPPSVAVWLSGFTAGLMAAPLIRTGLAVLAVRLSHPPTTRTATGTAPRTGGKRTGGRTRRGGR
ncbi:hypothetical protein [Nonomuraea diastatica]|uniref:Uncharacterized protein n=1 Tax=Nonomuraea diastatica TaxID=1848329 RepID=A0A4V2YE36_9ACTN|nr:hypothetical protein [Nonomuraea diastatica]TDD17866.1 hypothetical protein E1294_26580 [Nonomuraea diastatica]